MQYRGIGYQVVQTANPTGWKWTVKLGGDRTRTGSAHNRTVAIGLAQLAIDKAINEASTKLGPFEQPDPTEEGRAATT